MAANENASFAETTLPLPSDANAPALARTFVSDHLDWLRPEQLDDALILVSELVTNAVRYGQPEITLRLRSQPPSVGVEVSDHGPQLPQVAQAPPDPQEISGRGLLIVDALANRWGITPDRPPTGKTVWFELVPPAITDPSASGSV